MQFTKRRVKALEILARLHSEGLAWARVIDMLPEAEKHQQDSLRRVLVRLVAHAVVERVIPRERQEWRLYRLTPAGVKALETYRDEAARVAVMKLRVTKPALSPERALLLMQLEYAGEAGLLISDVAGFLPTGVSQVISRMLARGLCERITTKPPHAYRATVAGKEALAEYRRYARASQRIDAEIERVKGLQSPVDELARLSKPSGYTSQVNH